MFPAAFDYRAPTSIDEALGVLSQRGDEAKVMEGGQSLIPLLKLRFARPGLVLDLAHIPNLDTIKRDDAGVGLRNPAQFQNQIFFWRIALYSVHVGRELFDETALLPVNGQCHRDNQDNSIDRFLCVGIDIHEDQLRRVLERQRDAFFGFHVAQY